MYSAILCWAVGGANRLVELIYLDLEDERPGFVEDPTFNVIPDIEDFFDVDFDFLEEGEESEEVLSFS